MGIAAEMFELMMAVRADYVGIPTFLAGLTLTASVAGQFDTAAQRLEYALAIERAFGDAPLYTRMSNELALALDHRGQPGDRQRSAEVRDGRRNRQRVDSAGIAPEVSRRF